MKNKRYVKSLPACVALMTRMLFLTVMVLLLADLGFARMYEKPMSFSLEDKSLEKVQFKVLPKIDIERLLAEDRARGRDSKRPLPLRFAVVADVAFTPDNSGTWLTLSKGRIWRLRIQSPGAKSLNIGITRFDMPEGAKLWLYDPGQKHVEGPYTSRHRSKRGSLWTPIIEGDEIVVEVFVPAGISKLAITIGKISQGYRGFGTSSEKGGFAGTEGTCNNDVICSPEGDPWRDQIRAVGVYTFTVGADTYVCTGTLMNDTAYDFKPYFLTANHCTVDATNDSTVVVYWNFQSSTCGTHGPGSIADNQTGAIFRAAYSPSDFRLLELSSNPDLSFNVFHAGWDASTAIPTSTVCIHHPSGDVKAISFDNNAPDTTVYGSGTHDASGNHWLVDWDSGVTEGGSSGSCLFETTNKRCIGQLHGGYSLCGSADMRDWYGRFSVSWTGGGTDSTRLSNWLDPVPTGALTLDGDPHLTTANGIHYDFQGAGEFVALRDANGLEIQVRQAPISTTFNPGADPHDGLATCVSLNTAVAARVGNHRVTYEPNLSGVPDPSGLQLRVDGVLTMLGSSGIDLGNGGRIVQTATPGGLEIDFPDKSVLFVTPGWWDSQSKWYLNVDIVRPLAMNGAAQGSFPTGGIVGAITPGNWLPALPDGTSMGPMPVSLHQRYLDLYKKFADAWRVTDKTSLFDYAPGTSTDTFTMRSWPSENPPCVVPDTKPLKPAKRDVAQRLCKQVKDKNAYKNCIFDVMITGHPGFAKNYAQSQRIKAGSIRIMVSDNKNLTKFNEPVTFIATVTRTVRGGRGVPTGTVQFILDSDRIGRPIRLNSNGQASWETSSLRPGKHKVSAIFTPNRDSAFLPGSSSDYIHTVRGEND